MRGAVEPAEEDGCTSGSDYLFDRSPIRVIGSDNRVSGAELVNDSRPIPQLPLVTTAMVWTHFPS